MNRSKWSFNTAEIDDSKREKVLNTYRGDELAKEYKKLMMNGLTVDYEILELVPKWYNMINGGAKTEEAILSINSDIGRIMDGIKEDYKLKMEQNPTEPENTSSSNSPFGDGWN